MAGEAAAVSAAGAHAAASSAGVVAAVLSVCECAFRAFVLCVQAVGRWEAAKAASCRLVV